MTSSDTSLVTTARGIAAEALRDEVRYDGTPFIGHADGVALIVQDEIGLDNGCIAAVYLHEATRIHRDIDISGFPDDVRLMVEGLTSDMIERLVVQEHYSLKQAIDVVMAERTDEEKEDGEEAD